MPDKPLTGPIKHVVVLMLENRGFDHLMGWLYPQLADAGPPNPDNGPPPPAPPPNSVANLRPPGWGGGALLSDPRGNPQSPTYDATWRGYQLKSYVGDQRAFMGLSYLDGQALAELVNQAPSGVEMPINKGARAPKTPSYNTGESYEHIMNQMWGVGQPATTWFKKANRDTFFQEAGNPPLADAPMTGYVKDFAIAVKHEAHKDLTDNELNEVMDTYLPGQMPVLSGLARAYAVSDEWYCSVPSQTNTNRAFSVCGTSRGMVNNNFYQPSNPSLWSGKKFAKLKNQALAAYYLEWRSFRDANDHLHIDTLPDSTRSMFEVLQEAKVSWKLYYQSEWPPRGLTTNFQWQYTRDSIPLLRNSEFNKNFEKFDVNDPNNSFFKAAEAGNLPSVTWIEPKWGGGPQWDTPFRLVGNDYHPVSDTTVGEDAVMKIYQALAKSRHWNQTLLVITFDENGGTYDHVPPPAADAPGNQACPLPKPEGVAEMDENTLTQFGFDFRQLGIRVPTLLVSPRVLPNTLFRSSEAGKVLDHASIIATILKMADIPKSNWMLGKRVSKAPTFEHVLAPDNAANYVPVKPLSVLDPRAPNAAAAQFNKRYILRYVGNPWSAEAQTTYMSAYYQGQVPLVGNLNYQYPTLNNQGARAVQFSFDPIIPLDIELGLDIQNMSFLRIKTSENTYAENKYISVAGNNKYAFYHNAASGPGNVWQVRLLNSREKDDKIYENDLVYFVSGLPVADGKDPLWRLLPYPTDKTYLTTRPAEWALWQIVAIPVPF